MFPTLDRDKIPKSLFYPLKAKFLSEELADVPQANELQLWFLNRNTPAKLRRLTKFQIVEVWYHHWEDNRFMPRRTNESSLKWVIQIYAIPVEIRVCVTQLLHDEALPKLRAWLLASADVENRRSCRIEVFYHEANDELEYFRRET